MGLQRSELQSSFEIPSNDTSLPGWEIYRGEAHPSAMVRAQQRLEVPWILEKIRRHIGYRANILDLGCGYGSVANELAQKGHFVTGVDHDQDALTIAKIWDKTQSVQYRLGDIYKLPFSGKSFDVVTALNMLHHLDHHADALLEANRVLKPGGIFIFNHFNHTRAAWLIAVKGPEWFIKNTPEHYHDYAHFLKPRAMMKHLKRAGLDPMQFRGISPVFCQTSLVKLLYSGAVSEHFRFHFCRTPWLGYIGIAQKRRY